MNDVAEVPSHEQITAVIEPSEELVEVAGRYRIERRLGRGGMASVYAAHDELLDRPVALKVLSAKFEGQQAALDRFLQEARFIARLHHPNVVEVLNFGTTKSGLVYLTMELLDGEDLRQMLARKGVLSWQQALPIMLDLCAGLGAAHRRGIVHCDLKPANCVRVVHDGEEMVRIVDFGIATDVSHQRPASKQVVGTPTYMSPEQAQGLDVDHRADVYAAGIILGELLTGRVPFEGASTTAVLTAQIYMQPPALSELAPAGVMIPPALDALYARALAKRPEDRFASMEAFADALRDLDISGAFDSLLPTWSLSRVTAAPRRVSTGPANALRVGIAALVIFALGGVSGVAASELVEEVPKAATPSDAVDQLELASDLQVEAEWGPVYARSQPATPEPVSRSHRQARIDEVEDTDEGEGETPEAIEELPGLEEPPGHRELPGLEPAPMESPEPNQASLEEGMLAPPRHGAPALLDVD